MMVPPLSPVRGRAGRRGVGPSPRPLAHAARGPDRFYGVELHRLRGELTLERAGGAADAAETDFRRAIAIAREQAARSLELRTAVSLARLLRATSPRRGVGLLHDLCRGFTEGFETRHLREAAALLDELP